MSLIKERKLIIQLTDYDKVVTTISRKSEELHDLYGTLQFFEEAIRGPLGFIVPSLHKLTFLPEGEL